MKKLAPVTVSFEFFPPKTQEGVNTLYNTAMTLAKCNPQFFSVTFGALGSTRDGTVDTVTMLKQNTDIIVAPHLSCITSTRKDLLDLVNHYQSIGVRRILALRGDIPPNATNLNGEFEYASDLVAFIRETTGNHFQIIVAAYPEIHPQAENAFNDVLNLKRKYEAGANTAITQYFFNPDAYFYYLDDCVKYGIHLPIIPGIMPITQFAKLARFSDACGAEIPRWIRKRLESYGDDLESVKKFGFEVVYKLCEDLIAGGAPGLHFYTLNHAEASLKLVNQLNLAGSHASAIAHDRDDGLLHPKEPLSVISHN